MRARGRAIYCLPALLMPMLLAAPPLTAAEEIGAELLDTCRAGQQAMRGDPTASVRYGLCLGYLKGFADLRDGDGFCLPPLDTVQLTQQLKLAYLRFASGHPERLHQPARETVLPAFRQAFPCTR